MILSWIVYIIHLILIIYGGIISLSILLSWIPGSDNIQVFRGIKYLASWYLGLFSGKITIGFLDLTPLIGIIIYEFIINGLWI